MALQTEYKTLLIERNDGVTTLRLNRPEKKKKQQGGWLEKGIGSFLAKEYKPGLGSAPSLKQEG